MMYGFDARPPNPGGPMRPVLPNYPPGPVQRPEYVQGTWTDNFLASFNETVKGFNLLRALILCFSSMALR